MTKGYEFELSDGTILRCVPNSGISEFSISHGDTKIQIDVTASSFQIIVPDDKAIAETPTVIRFEPKDITVGACQTPVKINDQPHIMRTCVPCNGRGCCVTGGCVDCGCGWICD